MTFSPRIAQTIILVFLVIPLCCSYTYAASTVSYYADLIVFHFAEDYQVGQFVNGDYWVHNNGGDVVITTITPQSYNNSGRIIHGTMINPIDSGSQGYDSNPRDMSYSAVLNVDPGNTGESLSVPPGTSVIKSISMEDDSGRPIISDAVVLTVLAETPPEESFRPPYAGSEKAVIATFNDLDFQMLGRYPQLGNEPGIEAISKRYERVWLEHCTAWMQRDIHPENNMPTYGRDIAKGLAEGLILLQLDYTNEQKKKLLVGLVQYGIDIYGVAKIGGAWNNNGGHNLGRKMPLLLAAQVLHNPFMLAYADKEQHFIFQDDQQHFYVSQAEVDRTHCIGCSDCISCWDPDSRAEATPYEVADIGMAEWGIRHATDPRRDNANWGATYRHVVGSAQTMQVFAAQLMGVKEQWNWPPLFDYADRYYEIEQEKFPPYFIELWTAYRDNLSHAPAADINGDGETDLHDVILTLQVLAGTQPPGVRSDYPASGADVDGDDRISLAEAIEALRRRQQPQ